MIEDRDIVISSRENYERVMDQNEAMKNLLERFLDLCPRMNEGDPIGPALRDACHDTKRILYPIKQNITIYEANNGND